MGNLMKIELTDRKKPTEPKIENEESMLNKGHLDVKKGRHRLVTSLN